MDFSTIIPNFEHHHGVNRKVEHPAIESPKMNKCTIQVNMLAVLMFSLFSCTTGVNQKPKATPIANTDSKYKLEDIDSSYFGALVDTILNHSRIKFERIEKENVDFFYEPDSFFDKQIPILITQAIESKKHCEKLLGVKVVTQKMRIIYFNNREKLRPFLKMAPKGYALPDAYTLLIATNDSLRAYHTHELMHIISISQFGGYAAQPADWIQEGLSVFADNPCMNYSIHAIAANLLYSKKIATIDSIFYHFRRLPDMAGYMQAGSVVQYFIEKYGIEKFAMLWKRGVGELSQIIEMSSEDFETEYHEFLRKTYKQKPEINWDLLNKNGCG